ncbi:MAG: general secretion pathway protein A [Woeseiaceae bacterium]|jgi:general secretion pathway protein A|tara:strand:- start:10850 stop:11845 length:996 start_codon:yes stop_codon:yes gene_type:complete
MAHQLPNKQKILKVEKLTIMYEQYFGLNSKPFTITPDPRYLFMSDRHTEGLAHLLYGVTDSGGFIQLTGEVGTGKTTLIRALLEQLPKKIEIALIMHTQISAREFLIEVCNELKIKIIGTSIIDIVNSLNQYLLEQYSNGRRVILLVDEAQNLSTDVLEQLRLLTNLETAQKKLLQIILIGQPELRDILEKHNLSNLAQRITARYHLQPLSKLETDLYIDHRLRISGATAPIFNKKAKKEVFKFSSGIPRLINVICDRALLGAYGIGSIEINKEIIIKANKEIQGDTTAIKTKRWPFFLFLILTLSLITALFKYDYLDIDLMNKIINKFFT